MEYLERCIDAVLLSMQDATNKGISVELVTVDDSSTDGSFDWLQSRRSRSQLKDSWTIARVKSSSVSEVRNEGVAKSVAQILAFVDSDCVVQQNYCSEVCRISASLGSSLFGAKYLPRPGGHWSEIVWHELHGEPSDGPVKTINGGNLCISRDVLHAVGGWSSELLAGEDDELCLRAKAAGFDVVERRAIALVHLGNPQSLRAFFRKQRWHGSGIRAVTLRWKPMALFVYLHVALVLVAIVLLASVPRWSTLLPAAVMIFAVPSAVTALRWTRANRKTNIGQAVLLESVFFAARAVAWVSPVQRERKLLENRQADVHAA
jgi:GT2 family glycosyltransferase